MPAGRPKKYHSEEERKAAKRENRKRSRAKKKGVPASWLKTVSEKLSEAAGDVVPPKDETPPERTGEPFADLPPLDLPNTSAPTESTDATDSQDSSVASDAPKTDTPKPEPEIKLDTKELQQMAEGAAYATVMVLGKFAADRGYFALGEPFAKMAGQAARIIISARAAELGISSEEAAAWVLGGVVGVNATQAGRAWYEEYKKKADEERARFDARRAAANAQRQQNGVNPTDVAEQRKQQVEHADEARRTSGPVV